MMTTEEDRDALLGLLEWIEKDAGTSTRTRNVVRRVLAERGGEGDPTTRRLTPWPNMVGDQNETP